MTTIHLMTEEAKNDVDLTYDGPTAACDATAQRAPQREFTLTSIIEAEVNCQECRAILEER